MLKTYKTDGTDYSRRKTWIWVEKIPFENISSYFY